MKRRIEFWNRCLLSVCVLFTASRHFCYTISDTYSTLTEHRLQRVISKMSEPVSRTPEMSRYDREDDSDSDTDVLHRQRTRVESLESAVESRDAKIKELEATIASLWTQIHTLLDLSVLMTKTHVDTPQDKPPC